MEMLKMAKDGRPEVIKCPRCGCEYLPAEIYIPKNFVGTPKNIHKINGKVDWYIGLSMDRKETYICDKCDCQFTVVANVNFKTYTNDKKDFSDAYKQEVRRDKLIFDEG